MAKSGYRPVPLQTARTLESAGETFVQVYDARKGRGAVSNIQGRYDSVQRVSFDDGWDEIPVEGEDTAEPPALRTIVTAETAKSIISRNQSPDLPFNVSI